MSSEPTVPRRVPSVLDLPTGHYADDATDFAVFAALCERDIDPDDLPHADRLVERIACYDGRALARQVSSGDTVAVIAELGWCLANGPGVFVIRDAYEDLTVVDDMTALMAELLHEERRTGAGSGDHFAKPGANSRIWNVFQKSALAEPGVFLRYYGNPLLRLAALAWLGPGYQITAQLNVVHPGGSAQEPHRDYHLGFQNEQQARAFPRHAHLASQALTLQGAVAHSDMPIETGPTMFLPNSQRFPGGYVGYHDPRFVSYFRDHHVQLSLRRGDAVFFNPGLHHGAGHNRTSDVERTANLLQISSAMGKPLEAVDSYAVASAVFASLRDEVAAGSLTDAEFDARIAACADGYSFPTNLDTDPPVGALLPETAQDLLRRATTEGWSVDRFADALVRHRSRRAA